MDLGLADQKSALRRVMRAARKALPPREGALRSSQACRRLADLAEFGRARVVAGFKAKAGEIDPAQALDAARRSGATVVLPRVSDEQQPRLRFHWVATDADLRPGSYGLLEPDPSCPEVALHDIDLMVVPGLAFDAQCHRLGHGGGYYDEVAAGLRAARRGMLVGLGYDFQIVERCPVGAYDVSLDCVVTDERTLCRPANNMKAAP